MSTLKMYYEALVHTIEQIIVESSVFNEKVTDSPCYLDGKAVGHVLDVSITLRQQVLILTSLLNEVQYRLCCLMRRF